MNSGAQDYAKVDTIAQNYPDKCSSTVALAYRINADFTLNEEKVRAIKYKKRGPKNVAIYAELLPVLSFAINSNTN